MISICEVDAHRHVTGEITQLLQLPMFGNEVRNILPIAQEMASYHDLSCQEDPDQEYDALKFWKKNSIKLPNLANLVRQVACLTPSSATVERLFSMLNSFNDNQGSCLADYVKSRCMIRYNEIFRDRSHD